MKTSTTWTKGKAPGPGRPKGSVSKTTLQAREAIARFVDGNSHRLETWLDQIAAEDPEAAFKCFMSVVEYHVPKLARHEHTGDGGGPIVIQASQTDERL